MSNVVESDEAEWGLPQTRTTLIVLALIVVIGWLIRRRRRRRHPYSAQIDHPTFPKLVPGNGTPLFHGVRVVELATVVAAPTISAMMAMHGAEVIKVEPPSGDPWRKFFLEYELGRRFSSVFEAVNFNKSSVCLDLKTPAGRHELVKLLRGADVFVTNVREEPLRKLGIDYESMKDECPRLVYALLTAWGRSGPDCSLPGYDLGAFWAMSGMAGMIHKKDYYCKYPIGFGDTATGGSLLAGVVMALMHKMRTGRGQFVTNSLYANGIWTMASVFATVPETTDVPEIPNYTVKFRTSSVQQHFFETSDARFFLIDAKGGDDEVWSAIERLGVRTPPAGRSFLARVTPADDFFRLHTWQAVREMCASVSVEATRSNGVNHVLEPMNDDDGGEVLLHTSQSFMSIASAPDLPYMARQPLRFGCCDSSTSNPTRRAPMVGEHTDFILKHGWSERAPEAELYRGTVHEGIHQTHVLDGVVVVELCSSVRVDVAVATAQLAAMGATVYYVEVPGGDPLRRTNPAYFNTLNFAKRSVVLDVAASDADRQKLMAFLSKADLFATNHHVDDLRAWGVDYESVRVVNHRLVYGQSTPYGRESSTRASVYSAWYGRGTIGQTITTNGSAPPPFSNEVASSVVSSFLLATFAGGLFHQRRTGEGQLVGVNELNCAMWGNSQFYAVFRFDMTKCAFFNADPDTFHSDYPAPSCNVYETKDGMHVQLLGVEVPRHLPRLLRALGITRKVLCRLVPDLICKVIPNKAASRLLKLQPLCGAFNDNIDAAIGAMTWEECRRLFKEKDIWHACVLMPPQVRNHRQARAQRMFANTPSGTVVRAPLMLSANVPQVIDATSVAPSCGQHQAAFV